ncbi:MAG: hypothetical protein LKH93_15180 [Clostridium beijerinckii]|jgi:hypothetical protein|nr:hypothetical protein [Clostridium beijerinckii]MCI1579024.1 hypothetical protein [Clostridium beijerinckii]MCI1584353.1 hypothetical protein [Clostridium beijerinckii]MCI1623548.1 hypothetical protein [Clostridium beijerinckii]
MKKVLMYLVLVPTIIINIYFLLYWQPQDENSAKEVVVQETVSYSKPLYKINKEKALSQLSTDNKKELEKIIKKLSAFDIGKIKEYYEDTNDNESLIEIFKILKRRLTTEDYKKIQEISSSFLDIQEINKRIKNN